jgi:hypothetical protein
MCSISHGLPKPTMDKMAENMDKVVFNDDSPNRWVMHHPFNSAAAYEAMALQTTPTAWLLCRIQIHDKSHINILQK